MSIEAEARTGAELRATERLSVGLIQQVTERLHSLQQETGRSKTDLTNRAISLYWLMQEQKLAGKEIVLRGPDGSTEVIHFDF